MPDRIFHMTCPIFAGAALVWANVAGAAVGALTQNWNLTVIVAGVTAAIAAICGAVAVAAPMIGKTLATAVQGLAPGLIEVRKLLEEYNRGSLTGQIKDLTEMVADLKDDNARVKADLAESDIDRKERDERHIEREKFLLKRVDDANAKAHEIRNQLNADILSRDARIIEIEASRDAKFNEFEEEIKRLRLEVARLSTLLADRADAQDKRIEDNTAGIKALEARTGDAA